jgi:hypothetical protein
MLAMAPFRGRFVEIEGSACIRRRAAFHRLTVTFFSRRLVDKCSRAAAVVLFKVHG